MAPTTRAHDVKQKELQNLIVEKRLVIPEGEEGVRHTDNGNQQGYSNATPEPEPETSENDGDVKESRK